MGFLSRNMCHAAASIKRAPIELHDTHSISWIIITRNKAECFYSQLTTHNSQLTTRTSKKKTQGYQNTSDNNEYHSIIIFITMRVIGSFMKPAGQVISVGPNDSTISDALDLMLENKVGAVVVLAVGDFTVAGKSLFFRSIDYPILR
jgi:hypothetical protein